MQNLNVLSQRKLQANYIPKKVYIVYSCSLSNPQDIPEFYVEQSEVILHNDKYTQTGFGPLKQETLENVFNSLNKKNSNLNEYKIPKNVLYLKDEYNLCWYNKPQMKTISIKGKPIILDLPYVVFIYSKGDLFIYFSKFKPHANSKLRFCPLPNIYDSGNMCWGNIEKEENLTTYEEIIEFCEKSFYYTEFNEFHYNKPFFTGNIKTELDTNLYSFHININKCKIYQKLERCIRF